MDQFNKMLYFDEKIKKQIQEIYPWEMCPKCMITFGAVRFNLDHVDHFLALVRARRLPGFNMSEVEVAILKGQKEKIETWIQEIFPGESCPRCADENPEDATTHVDHFFDWVRTR